MNQLRSQGLLKCGIYSDVKYLIEFLESPLVLKRLNQFIQQTNQLQ